MESTILYGVTYLLSRLHFYILASDSWPLSVSAPLEKREHHTVHDNHVVGRLSPVKGPLQKIDLDPRSGAIPRRTRACMDST